MLRYGMLTFATFLLSIFISSASNATYGYYGYATADAGAYSPVALGNDVNLTSCGGNGSTGSQFHSFQYTGSWQHVSSYPFCQLQNLNDFGAKWRVFDSNWQLLGQWYYPQNAGDGINLTINTGAGTVFSSVGTYIVEHIIYTYSGNYVTVPGVPSAVQTVSTWQRDTALIQITEAIPVNEPMAALMLIPTLLYIRSRNRKFRKST